MITLVTHSPRSLKLDYWIVIGQDGAGEERHVNVQFLDKAKQLPKAARQLIMNQLHIQLSKELTRPRNKEAAQGPAESLHALLRADRTNFKFETPQLTEEQT